MIMRASKIDRRRHTSRRGGIFVVDLDKQSGTLQDLRIVPMFMNRLRLERWTEDSLVWKPNQRRMESKPNSQDLCDFVNKESIRDALRGEALLLDHQESDKEIPGGPVLRATK